MQNIQKENTPKMNNNGTEITLAQLCSIYSEDLSTQNEHKTLLIRIKKTVSMSKMENWIRQDCHIENSVY